MTLFFSFDVSQNPPFALTFDFVIADLLGARKEQDFYFIATTPGGVVHATAKLLR